jgi:23S rRNA pseudouridine2605 synthase
MAQERIQKIMSEQGLCSRRAAEQIIEEGRVKLNGHPVKLGDKMDPAADILTVDGERIQIEKDQKLYYLALYKPRGFVTTASDELGRKTVLDLVKNVPARVYPVGRLDKDSEGLLLLTNDGEFANAMMHPSGEVTKLYRVTVRPHATEQQVVQLSQGVTLDDGTQTLPAVVNVVVDEPGRTVMEMTLREGKNREIRRMCEAVGLEVIRLKRSAEGAVKLGMLQPGEYRELTKQELSALRAAAAKGRARTRTEAQQTRAAARGRARTATAGEGAKRPARSAGPTDAAKRPARSERAPRAAADRPARAGTRARTGENGDKKPAAGRPRGTSSKK